MMIRSEQFEVFRAASRESFIALMVTHVRAHHPGFVEGKSDSVVAGEVEALVAMAQEFGIHGKRPVRSFVDFMCLNGKDCLDRKGFEVPKAQLLDEELSEEAKIAGLSDFQTFCAGGRETAASGAKPCADGVGR